MINRKQLCILCTILSIMMIISLMGCSPQAPQAPDPEPETEAESAPEAEEIPVAELKIGHIFSPESVNHKTFQAYAEEVERLSNGTVKITIFPSSQLGTETEMLEAVQQGTIDIIMSGNGYGSFVPPFNAVGLPYLYKDSESLLAFIKTGGGWEIIEEILDGTGFMPISFWVLGAERSVLTKSPIESLADMNGLKMRTPEMSLFVQTFRAMGANPTPVAYTETYTAIQSGVVDGCEMSPGYIYDAKFHEVAPYYTLTRHFVEYGVVSINENTFNGLHPSQQEALLDAVGVMENYNQKNAPTANEEALEKMVEEGTIVIELAADVWQEFVDSVAPLYEEYSNEYGPLAQKYIEAAQAYAAANL